MTGFKKITALAASIALLLNICFIMPLSNLTASAEGAVSTEEYTVTYLNKDGSGALMTKEELAAIDERESVVSGKSAKVYSYDSDTDTLTDVSSSTASTFITDGNIEHKMFSKYDGSGIEGLTLQFDFGKSYSIDKFLFLGTSSLADTNVYVGAYDVYLADSVSDLYKETSKIYSYDYTQAGKTRGQVVTFNNAKNGRYLAVRFTSQCTTQSFDNYGYLRLAEIAVYGSRVNKETGDVNGDGYINSTDLVNLRMAILGIENVNTADAAYYDINADNSVNILDLVRLKKIISGVTVNFQ